MTNKIQQDESIKNIDPSDKNAVITALTIQNKKLHIAINSMKDEALRAQQITHIVRATTNNLNNYKDPKLLKIDMGIGTNHILHALERILNEPIMESSVPRMIKVCPDCDSPRIRYYTRRRRYKCEECEWEGNDFNVRLPHTTHPAFAFWS